MERHAAAYLAAFEVHVGRPLRPQPGFSPARARSRAEARRGLRGRPTKQAGILNVTMRNTCLALLLVAGAYAGAPPYAITNARIVVSPDKAISKGVILMRDGLIQAVGENVTIPPDARIYDAKGLPVYPGLIDACSHYGFPAPAPTNTVTRFSTAAPTTTPAPVSDDINAPERYLNPKPTGVNADVQAATKMTIPTQPDPRRNLGFTTVLTVPRDGNWQGASALVNLAGATAADAVVRSPVAMHVAFGTGTQFLRG